MLGWTWLGLESKRETDMKKRETKKLTKLTKYTDIKLALTNDDNTNKKKKGM